MENNINKEDIIKQKKLIGRTALVPYIGATLLVLHILGYNPIIKHKEESDKINSGVNSTKKKEVNYWLDSGIITSSGINLDNNYIEQIDILIHDSKKELASYKKEIETIEQKLKSLDNNELTTILLEKPQTKIEENKKRFNNIEERLNQTIIIRNKYVKLMKIINFMDMVYKGKVLYNKENIELRKTKHKIYLLSNLNLFEQGTQIQLQDKIKIIDEILD